MVFWPATAGLLRSKMVVSCEGRLVNTLSRSSCFGRFAVSCHFAAAASAFIALIDWNSFSATTARKLPSRTTLTTPCCFCHQQFTHLCRRILDRGAAVLHGVAA